MDFMNYIDRGGFIVYVLIGLNIIGMSIIIWKFLLLLIARTQREKIVETIFNFVNSNNERYTVESLHNAVEKEMSKLEFGLNTIKIIASISPLLGLLGTVIGVLQSFDSISKVGMGDPTVFSAGISMALITTVAGMAVAIPHFIAYNYFASLLNNIENYLEAQVIGKL